MATSSQKDIRTYSLEELQTYFKEIGEKPFRAQQVYDWLWNKNAHSFDDMTNLPHALRETLFQHFVIRPVAVSHTQKSKDGTFKNAVQLHDGNIVESVLIPTPKRTTACISSQVGCSLDCEFCATAKLKRMRNLTAAEIVDQVALTDKQSRQHYGRPLSNIVFMGMGEPLLNYKEVTEAIKIITADKGLGMAARRLTLSTSGISKMIYKLANDNLRVKLAVSLHSAREEVRKQIMPFSKNFSLKELQEALQYWYKKTKSKITFEYIVWKGVNDTQEDIDALVNFAKKVPSKVNLIEYNAIGDGKFEPADPAVVQHYITALEKNGIVAKVRKSRGQDIDAACGQLANKQTV